MKRELKFDSEFKEVINGHLCTIRCVHTGIRRNQDRYQGVVDGEIVYGPQTIYRETALRQAMHYAKNLPAITA